MFSLSKNGRNRPDLQVEALEDRWCPSTVAMLDNATQTLTITGDQAADKVQLVHDDNANEIHVLHDGVDETFVSSNVQTIVVNLKGGNDSFTQTLKEGTNFFRGKTLDVRMGVGADKVAFALAGDANHWAILKENLTIDLRTGRGADKVQIDLPTIEIANELRLTALLGGGADRFDAIAYGEVGATGGLFLDTRGEAGTDVLNYYGTYNPNDPAAGIKVADQAGLSVLFDGGAGADRLSATYIGEVDGLCSFYLHGDLHNAGGPDRDRVVVHMSTKPDSTGDLYGYSLGGRGNDLLQLLAEGQIPSDFILTADGGKGFDQCVSTFNVLVQNCEG
jgi:hypothetical protein